MEVKDTLYMVVRTSGSVQRPYIRLLYSHRGVNIGENPIPDFNKYYIIRRSENNENNYGFIINYWWDCIRIMTWIVGDVYWWNCWNY